MKHYFAFGSNMSVPRLEARVGRVEVLGCGHLRGFEHRFAKLGADGTAKGNIVARPSAVVHGVLYRLSPEQLVRLEDFEGGYRRREVLVHPQQGRPTAAETFIADEPYCPFAPSSDYLAHYARGLAEHAIDRAYVDAILADLDQTLVAAFEAVFEQARSNRQR